MKFMLFNANLDYKDENGQTISFEEHLEYVDRYCGTPDMWDMITAPSASTALIEAQKISDRTGFDFHVVNEVNNEIIGTIAPDVADEILNK